MTVDRRLERRKSCRTSTTTVDAGKDDTVGIVVAVGGDAQGPVAAVHVATSFAAVDGGAAVVAVGALERPRHKATCVVVVVGDVVKGRGREVIVERGERDEQLLSLGPSLLPPLLLLPAVAAGVWEETADRTKDTPCTPCRPGLRS